MTTRPTLVAPPKLSLGRCAFLAGSHADPPRIKRNIRNMWNIGLPMRLSLFHIVVVFRNLSIMRNTRVRSISGMFRMFHMFRLFRGCRARNVPRRHRKWPSCSP